MTHGEVERLLDRPAANDSDLQTRAIRRNGLDSHRHLRGFAVAGAGRGGGARGCSDDQSQYEQHKGCATCHGDPLSLERSAP